MVLSVGLEEWMSCKDVEVWMVWIDGGMTVLGNESIRYKV